MSKSSNYYLNQLVLKIYASDNSLYYCSLLYTLSYKIRSGPRSTTACIFVSINILRSCQNAMVSPETMCSSGPRAKYPPILVFSPRKSESVTDPREKISTKTAGSAVCARTLRLKTVVSFLQSLLKNPQRQSPFLT
jgi:hypothetical protein